MLKLIQIVLLCNNHIAFIYTDTIWGSGSKDWTLQIHNMCLHTIWIKVPTCIHTRSKRPNSRARAAMSLPAHLWPMLIWLDWIMVMCWGIWWVWGDALLLSFRGIVNWLGCFDVVVMREWGWWERLAKALYNSSPFYFWPMRDLCWQVVKRNETWWNQCADLQLKHCEYSDECGRNASHIWILCHFTVASRVNCWSLFLPSIVCDTTKKSIFIFIFKCMYSFKIWHLKCQHIDWVLWIFKAYNRQ